MQTALIQYMCICDLREWDSVVNWIQCHTWSMFYANGFGAGINRMFIRNYTIDRSTLLFVSLYSRTKEPFISAFDGPVNENRAPFLHVTY